MWGRHTHLAMAEYWRWWVVHLWVEGFFEVFATVVIAFLFTRLGLLRAATRHRRRAVLDRSIFLSGGIIGTFHHLYFTGTPTAVLALGAVVQRAGGRAAGADRLRGLREPARSAAPRPGWRRYQWPIYFFVAVAFWNLVGAGLFGFLINPPIALYYMQGLNTTPVHGHTALFGVYGMLGIGLMLFCLRGLSSRRRVGRAAARRRVLVDQHRPGADGAAVAAAGRADADLGRVEHGIWYARSAEFLQQPLMQHAALAARAGRHALRIGVLTAGGVRRQAVPRARPAQERRSGAAQAGEVATAS